MIRIIDLVKDKQVSFQFARGTSLWYATDCGFAFPVPFSDMGNGTFLSQDKAILFMRYIRKQLNRMSEEEKETYLMMKKSKELMDEYSDAFETLAKN